MMNEKPSLVVVAGGMRPETVRLQPWRYLFEVACQLGKQGWETLIITDGRDEEELLEQIKGVPVIQIKSIRSYLWQTNRELESTLEELQPGIVVWNLGLTSLLHQKRIQCQNSLLIGVFTSPVYSLKDLIKAGIPTLMQGIRLSGIHLVGALIPRRLFCFLRRRNLSLDGWVFQTETTRKAFARIFSPEEPMAAFLPGVDDHFVRKNMGDHQAIRSSLGYSDDNIVVVYFGSPAPLRGTICLVQAFEKARDQDGNLRLLLLSRLRAGELSRESRQLASAIESSRDSDDIQIISGFLEPDELAGTIAAGDIAALPFGLVPSDAPLSVLEAAALGKPVVTTRTACLPELAGTAENFLAEPGDSDSLARALIQAVDSLKEGIHPQNPGYQRQWCEMGDDWDTFLEGLCQDL